MKGLNKVVDKNLKFDNIKSLLKEICELYSGLTAFTIKRNELKIIKTYDQLYKDVNKVIIYLYDKEIKKKHIALIGTFNYEWCVLFLAIICSDNVAIPIDNNLSNEDIEHQLDVADVDYIYANSKKGKSISGYEFLSEELLREIITQESTHYLHITRTQKPTVMIFTSGTTSNSKLVVLSEENILCDLHYSIYLLDEEKLSTKKIIPVLPPTHMFQITAGILAPLVLGMNICISRGMKYISEEIKYYEPIALVLVPMVVRNIYEKIYSGIVKENQLKKFQIVTLLNNILVKVGIDISAILMKSIRKELGKKLKIIICGGAYLDPELVDKYKNLGISLRNGYGITECSPVISCNKRDNRKGTVGIPGYGEICQVKIVDDEVCVSGKIVAIGYYEKGGKIISLTTNGIFHTGDLGYLDADGFLHITGRKKNLIILEDGNNISPEELEQQIEENPYVHTVCVCERSYEHMQLLVAQIFPNYELADKEKVKHSIEEYIRDLNSKYPQYKKIKKIEFVDQDFEKTSLGKIKRYKILEG